MKPILTEMLDIYEEFGIDLHSIPNTLQSNMNNLIREIIKLRKENNES